MTHLLGEPRQDLPGEPRQEHKSMSQRLWLLGIVADVAAVLAVLAGSAQNIATVVGLVALMLGAVQLAASLGKPVDRWVVLAVVGIVAGAVTITVVISRSLMDTPTQANGVTSGATTTTDSTTAEPTTSETQPTTTTRSTPATPAVSRASGDKPILLTENYTVDLDSHEPAWGAKRMEDSAGGDDLRYDASYLWAANDIAPATAQATFDDCVRAGYRSHIGASDLVTDAAFCVKTTRGVYARIVLIAMESEQLTLDVVVWQKHT